MKFGMELKIGGEYFPVESKDAPLWWHGKGVSFTVSGYGCRIPSAYMVRFKGRWRRVYLAQYSNSGAAYIGRSLAAADAIVERVLL